jgi:hypothetical protein
VSGVSWCDGCGETVADTDAGFSPGVQRMAHDCGGKWVVLGPKVAKAIIDALYMNLSHECDRGMEASQLLYKASEAAREGEKQHRKGVWGPREGRYRGSVETAVRYFVVKWFMDPAKVTSALDAARLRADCLYASALREALGAFVLTGPAARGFAKIDYCVHITPADEE